jgi:hypothetical protein
MGEGSEGTRACSENNWLGSCKAHHFGSRTQEDRSGAKNAMGEGAGGKEEGDVDVGTLLTDNIVSDANRDEESEMNRNAKCEIKENGGWQLVAVNEALELDAAQLKRCPTCHGRVRLHPKGGGTPAHFEHREKHEGCPQCHRYDGGKVRLHPHRLD